MTHYEVSTSINLQRQWEVSLLELGGGPPGRMLSYDLSSASAQPLPIEAFLVWRGHEQEQEAYDDHEVGVPSLWLSGAQQAWVAQTLGNPVLGSESSLRLTHMSEFKS